LWKNERIAEKEALGAKGSGQKEDRPRLVRVTPEERVIFPAGMEIEKRTIQLLLPHQKWMLVGMKKI
jgi:hypothetical protein